MTLRFLPRALPGAALALLIAACASGGGPERGETIRSIERRGAPADEDLVVQPSRPVEASPEMALENYERLMELAPTGDTRAEAQRRMADLHVELDDIQPGPQSERRLHDAVDLYQQLLRDRPNDPGNDRVYYQLARAQQNLGDVDASVSTLAELSERYPDSPYAADGRFRRAELLFTTRRFDEAVPEYEAVLALREQTPFFEASQYKYGWSLYRLSRYEDALATLFTILDRELPPGEPSDPAAALETIDTASRDLARDVIRVSSLSYIGLGGGEAVGPSFQRLGQPRFYPLVYRALGEMLLERERFSDAAGAFSAFVDSHPRHDLAPDFQESVIGAYNEGGFEALIIAEKERYVDTYDPRAGYWSGRAPGNAVLTSLRGHLGDLSGYFHARAQEGTRDVEWPPARSDYLTAAGWYRRTLEVFPDAGDAPQVNFLLAETLYEGGEALEAADEYHRTAYSYAGHARSSDAGYKAVLTRYEVAEATPADNRRAADRRAVDEALQFAGAFLQHPERLPVLTRAAEDLYALNEYEDAISIAARVLRGNNPPPPLVRTALTVRADSEFTLERFTDAEASYLDLLPMVENAPDVPRDEAVRIADQLAQSIFRQGVAERDAGNVQAAVSQFMRIGMVTPNASIRPSAEYDAAILLAESGDWTGAARILEGFRTRFGEHELVPDADKQLAVAYERSGQPVAAAGAYTRIAARVSESSEIREEAGWNAASLYDEGGDAQRAMTAYESYLNSALAQPSRRTTATERLIALTSTGDPERHRRWLTQAADSAGRGDERAELLAARSNLALGEIEAQEAAKIALRQPLQQSLQQRRAYVDRAADRLGRAAAYGFDDVTPHAAHLLGEVYRSFAQALLDSERPRRLDAEARDEYELLLEDQAFPLEEEAIAVFESNLRRIADGAWNDSIRASWRALIDMVPGRYARDEVLEQSYEALH